ncbi:uncharacterized protein LOC110605224 isoform X3 [Manihot esculenta]|uniref:RING-type domain-containing protein n=1 Tax=Manihot esculenta TaxID=3983 RepID=A0A2C9U3M9_MANES|nr:uncharacterized protein LOC110605224 isoform X3 [Manihot esculenta]OAY24276.1 hypothetical protein MANES_17G002200v8 [Manihot esculenta]
MGSSGSKAYSGGASSSPSSSSSSSESGGGGRSGRKGKCTGSRVFQSSCLGAPSGSRDTNNDDNNVSDHVSKETGGNTSSTSQREGESDQVKIECYRKVKVEQSDETCVSSNLELDEWNQASITNTTSRMGNSSARAASTPSLTSQSSFLSRFSFVPGNVSFRLSRATSLGSSRPYRIPSTSLQMLNDEEEIRFRPRSANGIIDGNETRQSSNLLPTSLINRTHTQQCEGSSANLGCHYRASGLDNNEGNLNSSVHDQCRDRGGTRVGIDLTSHSPRILSDSDSFETRISDRRIGAQEPVDRNVRFSRTLSVGRLRDRVLRRSSLSDVTFCPLQQERQVRDAVQVSGRQTLGGEMRPSESEGNTLRSPTTSGYPPPGTSSSLFSINDHDLETTRSRDARYHDLLEHRSNFLERRRRIRSQVRALQRLGSRFENLSGHERSCISSGHHRTGHCTCRVTNRDANLNDDTSARASISRIVMLAEALFEVLDEIHQQSVVLSSRPSMSSLGSVPAPTEVVESLPVKLYSKLQKQQHEEAAQCYICLVEYEEGDSMRLLPCHHEFHRACIDKWLKEIHRVCPLCRGDVCRSDSLQSAS